MGSQCSVDDGGKRWLATSFGCCAPRFREKEDLEDLEEAARQTREEICEQQPQRFSLPHAEPALARPSTSYSTKSFSTLVAGGWDAASRVTTRTSASFWRPKTAESRQQLVIGAPSDFRRVDSVPIPRRRRQEFRPLELSIYLPHNRLSPLPDFSKSDWSAKPLDLEVPRPAMIRPATDPNLTFSTSTFVIQRKPVESASFLVSPSILDSNHSSLIYGSLAQDEPPTLPSQLPTVPPQSHSSSLVRSGTQSTRASDGWDITDPTSPPSSRSRALSEPLGLSRRQSNQSRGNRSDVDEAIRELNTIVEERRADANVRPGNDEDAADKDEEAGGHSPAHVPAIAPSMKMRVRTETLSDIGSALSIPHTSKVLSPPPLPPLETHSRQMSSSSLSTADIFDEPLRSPPSRSSARERLTNWIRTSLPFSPTGAPLPQLEIKSPTALLTMTDLPPRTPPHFQTSHQNMNVHPLYSCPPITPVRDSFSTVTASPHSSIQSSPSKTTRTVATSITEVDSDSGGKKSFEAGRSISSVLEYERIQMRTKTEAGADKWKEMENFPERAVNVGVAY